jgi:hypothetical protein
MTAAGYWNLRARGRRHAHDLPKKTFSSCTERLGTTSASMNSHGIMGAASTPTRSGLRNRGPTSTRRRVPEYRERLFGEQQYWAGGVEWYAREWRPRSRWAEVCRIQRCMRW